MQVRHEANGLAANHHRLREVRPSIKQTGSKADLGLSASVYNTFSTFLVGTNVLTAGQCNCLISCAFVVLRDTKPNSRIVWEGRQLSRPPKAAQPPSCPFGSEWVVMTTCAVHKASELDWALTSTPNTIKAT
mmetsp:Transcript_9934/g.15265  ORF Transcript_9934/g.15265 Transcript_9934/m.15265 type:complete len:132 (+) Transcript_9934:943-1338(+)